MNIILNNIDQGRDDTKTFIKGNKTRQIKENTIGLISRFLEVGSEVKEDKEEYNDLRLKIKKLFKKLLERELFSNDRKFLFDYNNNNEINTKKISDKIDRNFLVYFPLIAKKIYIDLGKIKIDSSEGKDIIKSNIKKTLNIFFIYGDKIELDFFENMLQYTEKELEEKKEIFQNNTNLLENEEHKNNMLIGDFYNVKDLGTKDCILSSAYRIANKKAQINIIKYRKSNKDINSLQLEEKYNEYLAQNLEKELSILFTNMYNLFKKTIDLKTDLNNRLKIEGINFQKIINYINILKTNSLAFINIKASLEDELYYFLISKSLVKGGLDNNQIENKIFITFLRETTLGKYSNTLKSIEIRKKIQRKSKIEESMGSSKIVNNYKQFFTDTFILSDKGHIKLKINKTKLRKKELRRFKKVINEISIILRQGISLESFIKNNINKFLFLYNYWQKNISKESNQIDFGLIDIILKEIKNNNGKVNFSKLDLNPNGRLHNMSKSNVGNYIKNYFYSFSKGAIELENYKIGSLKLHKEFKLFIKGEGNDATQTNDYINNGIEAIVKLLQGKSNFNTEEKEYLRILLEKKLITKDISKINKKQKNQLIKLIEGLKVIHSKIETLEKMIEVAKEEYGTIYSVFKDFIKKEKDFDARLANGMGPDKDFGRAFIKLIKNYNGDFHKLGDLTRLRISEKNISSLKTKFIDFLKIAINSNEIIDIGVEDRSGHPFSEARKSSGYRDLKAVFTTKSGNVGEFQFHYYEMLKVKEKGIQIDASKIEKKDITLNGKELALFTKLLNKVTKKNIHIGLLEAISGKEFNDIKKIVDNECFSTGGRDIISADDVYDIRRNLPKNNSLAKKLEKLEKLIFDNSWSKIVLNYIKKEIKVFN